MEHDLLFETVVSILSYIGIAKQRLPDLMPHETHEPLYTNFWYRKHV